MILKCLHHLSQECFNLSFIKYSHGSELFQESRLNKMIKFSPSTFTVIFSMYFMKTELRKTEELRLLGLSSLSKSSKSAEECLECQRKEWHGATFSKMQLGDSLSLVLRIFKKASISSVKLIFKFFKGELSNKMLMFLSSEFHKCYN